MTPAATEHQTVLEQPGEHRTGRLELHLHRLLGRPVTTFEVHEPHERLTVHAQARGRDPRRRSGLGHRPPGGTE